MMTPIDILTNDSFNNFLMDCGLIYQKKQTTALRFPSSEEIGQTLITYKSVDGVLIEESRTIISEENVIARNLKIIGRESNGDPIYNEWQIPIDVAIENYGIDAYFEISMTFKEFKKIATITAVKLDSSLCEYLGGENDTLYLKVSWSDSPMIAHVGDYLTSGGYSIAKANMEDYEECDGLTFKPSVVKITD
jgi:hypothetical protein